jgi:hypothetical protein
MPEMADHLRVSGRKAKTIDEWCAERRITRRTFENWRRKNLTPKITQPAGPKGRMTISPEDEAEWNRAYSRIAASLTAAEDKEEDNQRV